MFELVCVCLFQDEEEEEEKEEQRYEGSGMDRDLVNFGRNLHFNYYIIRDGFWIAYASSPTEFFCKIKNLAIFLFTLNFACNLVIQICTDQPYDG